jgi:uncharacterized heparinase superfamily protein
VSAFVHQFARDLRTARHLPAAQFVHRLRFLCLRRFYAAFPTRPIRAARGRARGALSRRDLPRVAPQLLGVKSECVDRAEAAAAGRFAHLSTERNYGAAIDWRDPTVSPLWAYQMHYLGILVDCAVAGRPEVAAAHLSSWTATFGDAWDPVAWHPYPVSLRLVNVCLAASVLGSFDALGDGAVELVATHARYLEEHLERDVRGNHLLENAVALVTAARFVDGSADERAALRLLRDVVEEQVLPDGMHFELSPMYHAIVLQRLLLLRQMVECGPLVHGIVERMQARLAWMVCPDGEIPLFGDSARDFAPAAVALVGGDTRPDAAAAMPACTTAARSTATARSTAAASEGVSSAEDAGLHVLRAGPLWCIFDTGAICPTYLPAHGQADALSVEVWVGDACLVTDPGLHEYTGDERAWGRSSRAHSTITVDDRDSSEVYASFRVGGRERMETVATDNHSVTATLRPWGVDARLTRRVALDAGGVLSLQDEARTTSAAVVRSRLHLHPDVEIVRGEGTDRLVLSVGGSRVLVRGSGPLFLEPGRCSRRLGEIRETCIVVLIHETGDDGVQRGSLEIDTEWARSEGAA